MAEATDPKQRLAAILAADVAGYSRLMQADERATIATLNEYRGLFRTEIETHGGRVVDMAGDSVLAVFDSAIGAVTAAVQIQGELAQRNEALPDDRRMAFRIGVNLGDIFEQTDGTVYGDGVNVAARLEAMASPGGINVSGSVFDSVRSKVGVSFDFLGEQDVKNIADPVRAYRVAKGDPQSPNEHARAPKRKWVAGLAAAIVLAIVAGGLWRSGVFNPPGADQSETPNTAINAQNEGDGATEHLPPTDKASVAVLPFQNLTTDPEHAFLADGLHENIIATLSQARSLFVPARFSTLQYKDANVDVKNVARTLGVAHVLEGSVQATDQRVRITMQLIDAESGGHVWAERYDRPLDDVFDLQDEITLEVVRALQVRLTEGDQALRWSGGTRSLDAWKRVERGLALIRRFTKADSIKARALLEEAVQIDPNYVLAWSYLSVANEQTYRYGWSDDPIFLERAEEYLAKALALNDELAAPYIPLAYLHRTRGRLKEGVAAAQKAVELDPNGSISRAALAEMLIVDGQIESALNSIDEAMRFSPVFPDWYMATKAHALLLAGAAVEAAELLEEYTRRVPSDPESIWQLPIAQARAGRLELAEHAIASLRQAEPTASIESFRQFASRVWPYRDPDILQGHIRVLRDLGLPEHPPHADADKPSIAVLPFENLSGDPEQDYFAKGISEELITALGRFPALRVAARGASFLLAGEAPVEVAQELSVGFVLEGSVRKSGNAIRIDARLASAEGNQIWAERFERDLTAANLFAIQDDITSRVSARIASGHGTMAEDILARRQMNRTDDLGAYECYLRSLRILDAPSPGIYAEGRDCLEAAVVADPKFVDGWYLLKYIYESEYLFGFNPRPQPLERALDAAQKVLALDPTHPKGLYGLATIYFMRQEISQFYDTANRALRVNPNDTETMYDLGWMIAYAGQWERGIALVDRAFELNPAIGSRIYIPKSIDKYRRSDFVGALAAAQRINMPDFWRDRFVTTIALAQLGRLDEARQSLDRMLELHPAFAEDPWGECRKWNWSDELITHILDGFRKAGLAIPPDPAE